jgi:regulator of RNase E activity RraA
MPHTLSPDLLASVRKHLTSAQIGDVLDRMGRHDNFFPPQIHPLAPEMVVLGRARPAIVEDYPGTLEDPFGRLLEALDATTEGDVFVTNGGQTHYALWGELMATRAAHLKAAGAVMNGYHRDTNGILALGFPTFSWGAYSLDLSFRGRIVDFNVPTTVGNVSVAPGDYIFGDRDGVLLVSEDIAEEVFQAAMEKFNTENLVREGFRKGMPAVEAWAKYHVM